VISLLLALVIVQPASAQEETEAPATEGASDEAPAAPEAEEAPAAPEAEEAPAAPEAEEAPAAPEAEEAPAAPEAEEAKKEAWEKKGWGWGGLPFVVYSSDDGVNVGLIGSIYKYDGETAPYKTRIGWLASFTSKGILYEYIDVDAVGLAGGKLRLTTRLLFDSRFSEPFCGIGGDVQCDDDTAYDQMDELGVPEADQEDSLTRWYQAAYRMPYGLVWARYELAEKPHAVELIGSYRLSYLSPWDKFDHTYYGEGWDADDEKGFTSVLQAGIMADNRDNEPSPFRGYWVEATVRGASKFWGSKYDYFGFNTTLRGYLPILSEGRLTLADRFVFDGIVGDANMKELDWLGGYQMYTGLGGARSLRGVRANRYRGKVKILNQAELRWRFVRWKPGSTVVDFYLQAFLDAGQVAAEWEDLGDSPIQLGEGLGLRIAFNQNFILRGDFATSASEGWGLSGLYLDVDNLW